MVDQTTNEIPGSKPSKFTHNIKRHAFDNSNRNEIDNLSELLSKIALFYLFLVNDPSSIQDLSARK